MYDNTFIFAFSDNGGDVRTGASNHPYRGDKMSVWEGGTRSPAFIHSPNPNIIPENIRGTDSEALGHAVDLFPTLSDLANLNIPKKCFLIPNSGTFRTPLFEKWPKFLIFYL